MPGPPPTEGMWTFGRKREEFLADVLLVARRTLSEADWRLFDLHFVRGLEWSRCCSYLGYSRGYFFHAVYRVQEALGRAWVEVQPFPLCPPSGYFSGRRLDRVTLDTCPNRLAALRAAARTLTDYTEGNSTKVESYGPVDPTRFIEERRHGLRRGCRPNQR